MKKIKPFKIIGGSVLRGLAIGGVATIAIVLMFMPAIFEDTIKENRPPVKTGTLTCQIDQDNSVFTVLDLPIKMKPEMKFEAILATAGYPDLEVELVITTLSVTPTETRASFTVYNTRIEPKLLFAFFDKHPFAKSLTPVVSKCMMSPFDG